MGTLRKAANLTLDADLQDQARALGINISRAAEDGLRAAVKRAREDAWKAENADSIAAWNRYVEENGLPLADTRLF